MPRDVLIADICQKQKITPRKKRF